jgi:gliding motility-associated-like protein
MNKRMISLMAAALALLSASGQVTFTGGQTAEHPTIEITLSNNHTSLNKIYVVYDIEGVSMTFNSSTGQPAKWENYDYHNGEQVTEPVPGVRWNGMATTLDKIIPNKGYIITEGNTPFYCWVVNYADYYFELNDVSFNEEASCNLLSLKIDGQGDAIPYYELNGRRQVLDREIKLTYMTKEWNDSTWEEQEVVESFPALDQSLEITPPLWETEFILSGDRFLKEWGLEKMIDEIPYTPYAVGCGATAIQEIRDNFNEKGLPSGLGGSAPVHIVFTGYPTDAAVYRVWEMATDQDFENVIMQWNQNEVDYTFNEFGTYYMRYMVANASGSCEAYSETFTIVVSESELECPNVFSPGTKDEINDIWKVSYKSLVEFHCWIFNRWGTLMCEFTDPGDGWDGTYNGKLVDTGVYYYVITALGSDGKSYKRRGDITIIQYKGGANGTSNGMDGGGF